MPWSAVAITPEVWSPVDRDPDTVEVEAVNDHFLLDYLLTENGRVILTETHFGLRP